MPIQLEVYDRTGLKRLDVIPFRQKPAFLEELIGPGGGSFQISSNDERLTEDPTLFQDRNIIKARVDGKIRAAFIIQGDNATEIDSNEASGENIVISGKGLKDWLRDAHVEPEFGLTGNKFARRTFNFASGSQQIVGSSFLKAANWKSPYNLVKFGGPPKTSAGDTSFSWAGTNANPWLYKPANWPDAPNSYWMWSSKAMTVEPGFNFFRAEFGVTKSQAGSYSFFCAADDVYEVYVDGQVVHTAQSGKVNRDQTQRIDFKVTETGIHTIGVKVQNLSNRGGFIGTLFKNGDPSLAPDRKKGVAYIESPNSPWLSQIVIRSTAADWKVAGYPKVAPNWTVGEIWLTLLAEAGRRGVRFPQYLRPTFTASKDSSGKAWARDLEWSFDVGTNYADIMAQMEDLACEFWIDPGTQEFHIYANRGTDRTLANSNAVILRKALNLTQATQKRESDIKNSLLVNTSGNRIVRKDAASIAKYGVIEDSLDVSADTNAAKLIADRVLTQTSKPTVGAAYKVTATEETVPFVDYSVGDWIMAPGTEGPRTRRRVSSISISEKDAGTVEYALEFDTVYQNRQARLERWMQNTIAGTMNGRVPSAASSLKNFNSAISGIGATTGFAVTAPEAPLVTLATTSLGSYTAAGVALSSAALEWEPVTFNTDGAEVEVAKYEVWGSLATDTFAAPTLLATTDQTAVEITGLTPVADYELTIVAVSASGTMSQPSDILTLTTEFPVVSDSTPSAPTATSAVGQLSVTWDGLNERSEPMPPGIVGVYAAVSDNKGGPYDITGAVINPAGGSAVVTDLLVGVEYYVTLIAKDASGTYSDFSEETFIGVAPVSLAEVAGDVTEAIEYAQSTADGKNTIYRSDQDPDPERGNEGDRWEKYNMSVNPWRLLGSWYREAGLWQSVALDATYLPLVDIGSGTFGQLTGVRLAVDALDGKLITGATIRTAATGQRVQLDPEGLRTFNASNVPTASLTAGNGGLDLTGNIVSTGGELGQVDTATLGSGELRFRGVSGGVWWTTALGPAGVFADGNMNTPLYISHDSNSPGSDIILEPANGDIVFSTPKGNLRHTGDTLWQNVSTASGITGNVQWRRYAHRIHMRFNLTSTTAIASDAAINPVCTMPVAARADLRSGDIESFAVIWGGTGGGVGLMTASGVIAVRNLHTTAQSIFKATASWLPAT